MTKFRSHADYKIRNRSKNLGLQNYSIFKGTIAKQNKRYQVSWLWKDSNVCLNDNYGFCLERSKTLIRRFYTDDKLLLNQYDEIIQEQMESI
uniref:Uncharacterized protein n=1 Tax=Wuchereria bancrofti TaxID=6293 RepID=A0AAF5Q7U1_WUCBA